MYGSGGVFDRACKFLYDKPSVLLGRKGTIDKPLYVDVPFWTVDTMYYTEIKNNNSTKFFYYLCLTISFELFQYGSAVPSMTQKDLTSISFPFPKEIREQTEIAKYLDHRTNTIDAIIANVKMQIETLKELRKTLTSDVITGKVKLKG